MAFDLNHFQDPTFGESYLQHLLDDRADAHARRYGRLWKYFRNPLVPAAGPSAGELNENSRPYFQAQEAGLPARITGVQRIGSGERMTDLRRKEVVIENDIGWRISTMVDFLFGQAPRIQSLAADPATAEAIETVLRGFLDANGSTTLLQDMALLGAVYGHVDLVLRIPADWPALRLPGPPGHRAADSGEAPAPSPRPGSSSNSRDGQHPPCGDRFSPSIPRACSLARTLRVETVDAPRILPVLDEDDYRTIRYWIQTYTKYPSRMEDGKTPLRFLGFGSRVEPSTVEVVEILAPHWWQRYEDRELVAEGPNLIGRLPIVHIQNVACPGSYTGLGDVEPLIPLQDELNTRLSDRAHRVTYQSFKMYLGRGIEDFLERPVGPGQMWATQNPQATIEEFGRDDGSPSEDAHIEQVRRALDKASGVTPLAAGLVRDNVGHLTSATALRVVLSGLMARTEGKRLTYGAGLARLAEMVLDWLDHTGVLATRPEDRRIELHWPSPLPGEEAERLRAAEQKKQLGVPDRQILAELGYVTEQLQ